MPPPGFAAAPASEPSSEPPPAGRSRPKLLAGLAGLVVLAAAGFLLLGSSGTQIGGPVAQAATLSSSSPGYRMHVTLQMSSSALGTPITASGHGVVDVRDRASSMSVTMNVGAQAQAVQQLGSSIVHMETVTVGSAVYVKLPSALTASLPSSGRPWVKVDLGKLAALPGLSSLGSNPTTSDPGSMLEFLRSASGGVVAEGRQRIDGEETTHYRTELSLDHLADSLPEPERGAVQQAFSRIQQSGGAGELPVDVWVDARNHVRRVVMALDLAVANGPSLQETVTMDLSHYGRQSLPATPPPDEIMDLSSVGGAAGP